MRRFLVSSFLADVTQQIHSFRAIGVIPVQRLLAALSDSMAFRKSDGSSWTVPPVIALVSMRQSCHVPCRTASCGFDVSAPVLACSASIILIPASELASVSFENSGNWRSSGIDPAW